MFSDGAEFRVAIDGVSSDYSAVGNTRPFMPNWATNEAAVMYALKGEVLVHRTFRLPATPKSVERLFNWFD